MMKLHFEPDLAHQLAPVEAACDLFKGQETLADEFTVYRAPAGPQGDFGYRAGDATETRGVGNPLKLDDDLLLENLQTVQLRNGLPVSEALGARDFTVEMETGTGKTYVYLRTALELNRRFGFTKFVIVVPSIAVKEGVLKTLSMTREHFHGLYAGTTLRSFEYRGKNLDRVRSFATGSGVEVMVTTIGSINKKDVNKLYQPGEQTNDEAPIDLIRRTHPVVIVDEPQSVTGGRAGRGEEALGRMEPLCTLRYSATHREAERHHPVYRLDAVDAFERGLVKQVEVASATVTGDHNRPHVKVVELKSARRRLQARVELDFERKAGIVQETVAIDGNTDLERLTGNPIYADHRVGEISARKGQKWVEVEVPGGTKYLSEGDSLHEVDEEAVTRQMVRRTLTEHFEKQLRLEHPASGDPDDRIKVLSLFFVGQVADYRAPGDGSEEATGPLAKTFEKEFVGLAQRPDFTPLFEGVEDLEAAAKAAHRGYFSVDKKGRSVETTENNAAGREAAERAYDLIMKKKEVLLGMDEPVRFLFSHSALREGWDNPNVFQVTALREMRGNTQRRQTLGRGLRLPVNAAGDRVRDPSVNVLTVVAREGYASFAANLQREYEETAGVKFGRVERHDFARVEVPEEGGSLLGAERSDRLWRALVAAGDLDAQGRVEDRLKTALKMNAVELPPEVGVPAGAAAGAVAVLRNRAGRHLDVRNAADRTTVRTREAVLNGEEFKALWSRIRGRTVYRVGFDAAELVEKATAALREMPPVAGARLQWETAGLQYRRSAIEAEVRERRAAYQLDEGGVPVPDVLTELEARTGLTRPSLVKVLVGSGRLDDLRRNPQAFVRAAAEAINRVRVSMLADGVRYRKLGESFAYAQELFEKQELHGYLHRNLLAAKKSVHEYVVYDSPHTEKPFAEELETNEAVKVYAKLPGWFKVPTPLGTYNPDWAVLVEEEDGDGAKRERLYLVIETKSTDNPDERRGIENKKIVCGKRHFEAVAAELENPVQYLDAVTLDGALRKAKKAV